MANAPFIKTDNGDSFVRLTMDTFNATTGNGGSTRYFKGTEMYSFSAFGPNVPNISDAQRRFIGQARVSTPPNESATGFEFESRIRWVNDPVLPQKGGVGAFWTYWNHGDDYHFDNSHYHASEIDYEMFYNQLYSNRTLNLQNYRDFYATGSDPYSNPVYTARADPAFTPDWNQWNYVKIVWTPKGDGEWRTQWYSKPTLAENYHPLGEEATRAPYKWMTVRFNIWDFGNAGDLQPATDPSQNHQYFLDVDWVKVTKVAPVSVSVTEVSGVSAPDGKTVPNLAVVKGQVSDASQTASQVNVVITRARDFGLVQV